MSHLDLPTPQSTSVIDVSPTPGTPQLRCIPTEISGVHYRRRIGEMLPFAAEIRGPNSYPGAPMSYKGRPGDPALTGNASPLAIQVHAVAIVIWMNQVVFAYDRDALLTGR